jgi:hypothetical protein
MSQRYSDRFEGFRVDQISTEEARPNTECWRPASRISGSPKCRKRSVCDRHETLIWVSFTAGIGGLAPKGLAVADPTPLHPGVNYSP